jgi:hypothetical protein
MLLTLGTITIRLIKKEITVSLMFPLYAKLSLAISTGNQISVIIRARIYKISVSVTHIL